MIFFPPVNQHNNKLFLELQRHNQFNVYVIVCGIALIKGMFHLRKSLLTPVRTKGTSTKQLISSVKKKQQTLEQHEEGLLGLMLRPILEERTERV